MIDYLTHPKFLNYDPSLLPSSQGGGGRDGHENVSRARSA